MSLTLNKEEAEDLMQETNLKVLDNDDKYVDNTNFKGWVFTIMRNIFINNYRRTARNKTIVDTSDSLYQLNQSSLSSTYDSPETTYNVKEISEVINSFSDDYRIPFSMYVAGYKYDEIAEQMNIPLGTVKSRIFFARKRLRSILENYHK